MHLGSFEPFREDNLIQGPFKNKKGTGKLKYLNFSTWSEDVVSRHSKLHSSRTHRRALCHHSQPDHSRVQGTGGQPSHNTQHIAVMGELCSLATHCQCITYHELSFFRAENIDIVAAHAEDNICPKTKLELCCA